MVLNNETVSTDQYANTVAYLGGGHGAMPPFGPTTKIFYKRFYMKRCVFCHFRARIVKFNNVWMVFCVSKCQKNGRICGFHWTFRSNVFQLQGGFAPLTPVIGSRSARSSRPPFPNPKYATAQTTEAFPLGWGTKFPWSWNASSFWTFNGSRKYACFLVFGDARNQLSAVCMIQDYSPWPFKNNIVPNTNSDIFQFSLTEGTLRQGQLTPCPRPPVAPG